MQNVIPILLLSFLLLGCIADQREVISFKGEILLSGDAQIPSDYAMVLLEERSQGKLVGTALVAVAKISPDKQGKFSFTGPVCKNLALTTLYGDIVREERNAPVWSEFLQFTFDEVETELLLNGDDNRIWDSELERINKLIEKYGAFEKIPC